MTALGEMSFFPLQPAQRNGCEFGSVSLLRISEPEGTLILQTCHASGVVRLILKCAINTTGSCCLAWRVLSRSKGAFSRFPLEKRDSLRTQAQTGGCSAHKSLTTPQHGKPLRPNIQGRMNKKPWLREKRRRRDMIVARPQHPILP